LTATTQKRNKTNNLIRLDGTLKRPKENRSVRIWFTGLRFSGYYFDRWSRPKVLTMKRVAALLIVVAVIAVLGHTERDSIVKSSAMRGIEAAFLAHFYSDHTG